MNLRRFTVIVLVVSILASILVAAASAAVWSPSLPASDVTIKITNLTEHEYPFLIELSDVGSGFDLTDGSYTGWCVDNEHNSDRGVEHVFKLCSSYGDDGLLPDGEWDMINYIINNKMGTGADVQVAIWFFVNDRSYYLPTAQFEISTETHAMVADAIAEGEGYVPEEGDLLAVVAVPTNGYSLQIMAFEVVVPGDVEPSPTSEPTSDPTSDPTSEPTSDPTSDPQTSPEPDLDSSSTPEPTLEPEDNPDGTIFGSEVVTAGLVIAIILVAVALGLGYYKHRRRS